MDDFAAEAEGPSAPAAPERVGPDFVLPQQVKEPGSPGSAHGSHDDTATERASWRAPVPGPVTDGHPTVGAAAYLGEAADADGQPEATADPAAGPAAGWVPPPPDVAGPAPWPPPTGPAPWPPPGPGGPTPGAWPPPGPSTAGPSTAAPSGGGRNWLLPVLVAAVIGGLLGAGLVAVLDRHRTDKVVTAFNPNQSVIAKPQDVQAILQRVQPGVVSVQTQLFQRSIFGDSIPAQGAGTGMIISSDGYVLTNNHVVRGATSIKVTLFNDKTAHDADLVGADPGQDVAVIKIRGVSGLSTVKFGSSGSLLVGDDVLAIGNALALPGGLSVTEGIVSAKDRSLDAENEHLEGLIQTDAAINPGNSGGPLVNGQGEVVGMNTAVIQSSGQELAQNIGFAIAIDTIKPLVTQLEKGGNAGGIVGSQAFIGVATVTMTPDIKQQYGFTVDKGAVATEITPGSPAENAGIQPGDVITKFGDQAIDSADQLVAAVHSHKPGDKVTVTYNRGGQTHTTTLTIGARPGTAGGGTGGTGGTGG